MNRAIRRASIAMLRRTKGWEPFERLDTDPVWLATNGERWLRHAAAMGDLLEAWRNNIYAVQVFARARINAPSVKHLAIRRHDGDEVHGWSDLQRIKNEIVGPDFAALEVYPPESDVVDQANMRHVFVLPKGEPAPFTIIGRWE